MQQDAKPSFLTSFFDSFTAIPRYADFTKRSALSFAGQFLVLMTLFCSLYALVGTLWLNKTFTPLLEDVARKIPTIEFVDGKAKVDIEQPYLVKDDKTKEVVAIVDTTKEPQSYLEEYKGQLMVFGETEMVTRDNRGMIKIMKYSEFHTNFTVNSSVAMQWVQRIQSWFLPVSFLLCFLWQFLAKVTEVLVVAGVVTLYQSSRPDFSTHFKLAILALGPAMAFSFAAFVLRMFVFAIPLSSLLFWGILGGLTVAASEKMKNTPQYS